MAFILERIKKYRSYLFLLLPLLILIPGMGGFPYPSADALYSDLTISHFPNAVYLREQLLAGEFPVWSNTILSGYPFAANPLSSIWYLPHYFALLFPLPFGLNFLVMIHLFFGGAGLLHYLRRQGLSEQAALFGALAFISMPKLYAHLGVGHLTLLYAIAWTPWLLLALEGKRDRWFNQPGLIMGIIFLADPRWAVYAGLLWLGWFVVRIRQDNLSERVVNFGFQLILAALLAAPLLLPLLNYTGLSTRIHMTPEDVYTFSMSPANLIGLFYPNFGAGQKDLVYFGLIPLALLIVVLMTRARRKASFWLWAAGLSLLYALGDNIPGMSLLARVPGLSLLRVPPRALFLTGLSFAILSAYAIDTLAALLEMKEKKRVRLSLMAATVFSVAIAVMVILFTGVSLEFVWGAVGLLLVWVLIEVWFARGMAFKIFFLILMLFALTDWGLMNQSLFGYQPREAVLAQSAEAAAWLADQPGDFRIYSPSYSIPQHTAVLYGLQLADGVDPMQLEAYAAYMEDAAGVPRVGYGVTIPAFAESGEDGDISQTNRDYLPDIELLTAINVRYIAAEFDMTLGLPIAAQFGQTRIYEIPTWPPQNPLEFDYGQYTQMMYLGLVGFAIGVIGLNWSARRQREV